MMSESVMYFAGSRTTEDCAEITDLELYKDDCGYCLATKIRVEDSHSIREVDIPKIRLNINKRRFMVRTGYDHRACKDGAWIDFGFGELPLECVITETVLEEKYTEMTLDDIEKKLGYKVKIVNK